MAHQRYRTRAVFLRKEDRGETDQLFTVLTEEYGKCRILGKAIRKIKSKLRSGADLFYLSEIEFIQGKSCKTLTDVLKVDGFRAWKKSPASLEFAWRLADALDALIGQGEKDNKVWQLTLETLQNLGNSKSRIVFYYFLWRLFVLLGYCPELHYCSFCRKKLLPETFFFTAQEGGLVCWQCFDKLKKEFLAGRPQEKKADVSLLGSEILPNTVKVLRFFLKEPQKEALKLSLEEKTFQNLEKISQIYLTYLKDLINPQDNLLTEFLA